ncbi:MAG: hypothetical protein ABSH35_24380 [Isosphaeraceae bacterium]
MLTISMIGKPSIQEGDHETSQFCCCDPLLAACSSSPRTTRADTIYAIQNYPSDQNGHTVSGTIATDGHIGQITSADITSWSVTFDSTFTFRSTDPGADIGSLGVVQATATNLSLSSPSVGFNQLEFGIFGTAGAPDVGSSINWGRATVEPGVYSGFLESTELWNLYRTTLGGTDPWVLAVAQASAIPEPASLWMAGIAISAGLAYGWFRHRREPQRQRPVGPPDATE